MSFLETLDPQEQAIVQQYFQPVHFQEGDCLVRQGDPGDGCYLSNRNRKLLRPKQQAASVEARHCPDRGSLLPRPGQCLASTEARCCSDQSSPI